MDDYATRDQRLAKVKLMKIVASIIKVFIAVIAIFSATIFLNSIFANAVLDANKFSTGLRYLPLVSLGFTEEMLRGLFGAFFSVKVFGEKKINKKILLAIFLVLALTFSFVEKYSMILNISTYFKDSYLFAAENFSNESYNFFILISSIALHFIIHFILISYSISAVLSKKYLSLIYISLCHAFINYLMVQAPIRTGDWVSLGENNMVKLFIVVALIALMILLRVFSKNPDRASLS